METALEDKMKFCVIRSSEGHTLYDTLKTMLKAVFLMPKYETYDSFEKINECIKKPDDNDSISPEQESVNLAKVKEKLFVKAEDEDTEPVIEEGFEHPLPNFMEVMYHFGKAGVGLCSYEITCLYLGLKMLVNSHPLKSARFWGKVFGLAKNYYIVETEFIEGEDEEGEEEAEQIKETPRNELTNLIDEAEENVETYPKSRWKPPPKVPQEPTHTGANKKVYFVCQEPGLPWIRLPPVTPEQIRLSRSICCLFTGNLDAKVDSTPSFPGTETNYLRAKIARISAATHISPEGFYQFGEEEEEEALDEEEGERQNYVRNEEYEPLPMEKLADRSLQHWVHHVSYILPQGRVTWWNPNQSLLDEMSEDEQEEEEEGLTILSPSKPERGPPILTSIAADASLSDYPAWSARLSSAIIPEHAVAVVSSNIWPGAHAIAWDKAFENIYIGWGVKATAPGFQPYLPQNVMDEFQNHSEVAELTDPTPEEEAALRKARAGPEEQEEIGEEGQEESNEEEESV
ncbi:hypothetical protein T265_11320 [Opisthorchis viverrini]|uniref:Radial spokehead-like protein n=1 Tax=Opisthorchis viverrini TaxID=6198 RepID=A0A074YZD8_OPIVI|nr:hypothetical protein T265_11320 [Opisthorchis viverrini]KER20038.1 hypothetical protein T265_11320 [Opisthorchis viverrini]